MPLTTCSSRNTQSKLLLSFLCLNEFQRRFWTDIVYPENSWSFLDILTSNGLCCFCEIGSGGCTSPVWRFLAYSLTVFSCFFRVGDFKLMSHYDAALYTARRLEMCEIVEMTLFYFIDRPQVHSALSGLPFMVSTLMSLWSHESHTSFYVRSWNNVFDSVYRVKAFMLIIGGLYLWGVICS